MTREECIQKIRHIQKSMYTFLFENRKLHQFKADDADKFYYYLDMIAKYLDEDVPKEQKPKIGHWITWKEAGNEIPSETRFECSVCHDAAQTLCNGLDLLSSYCPNCGAKMVEPQESEE